MTNFPDIRTGNQVFHNASGCVVTVLKVENDMVLLDTLPQSSYFSNAEISGIPLTTSMLEKLSFTNDEDINKWTGYGLNIHIREDGFFYGLRILKSRARIQHLHQLQNYIADYYSVFKEQKRSLNLSALY